MQPDAIEPEATQGFADLLAAWREADSAGTDDVLTAALPLIEQVAALHEEGKVAPLNGVDALRVSMGHLWFPNRMAGDAVDNASALRAVEQAEAARLEVTSRYKERSESGGVSVVDATVAERSEEQPRRAYYPDYIAWEQRAGHHDQLSDIFVLGLILGSLAMRLDLTDDEDMRSFARMRGDLMRHNPRLHPVLSQIIEKMTELDRRRRPQDLRQIANALAHYRDQDIELDDGDHEAAPDPSDRPGVRKHLHQKLRDRLFEINRRNRLIYFRETGATINLTVGSMPYLIDHKSIKPAQLFHLNDRISADLKRPIDLSSWLQFQDYEFLPANLDRIRLDAQRDAREYGFSQLRLVVAFLRWTNLKEAPNERINSPLILLPAELTRRKGVKDSFRLEAAPTEAQINPALRYYLRKLYDIRLPEFIDASSMEAVRALHADLVRQLARSAKGVDLALVETPRIMLIHRTARRKMDDFRRRRARTGVGIKDYAGLAYSYARGTYEPLGVQIFERDIRVSRAPRREMAEEGIKPKLHQMVAAEEAAADQAPAEPGPAERERTFYAVDDGNAAGSHDWEIDLCSVTLANFNYRKMTLVRDYADLIGKPAREHVNFDPLFSDEARRAFRPDSGARRENYMVLPADPSQMDAIARASTGESYVIQGPPGTGKSQTITNLIADYVARGKAVLFVCEKRAALDVVFHRLKQIGLGDVSTLIHDSQGDKKAFIEELKSIYEDWTARTPREDVARHRAALVGEIEARLAELQRFSAAMTAPVEEGGPPLRDLIEERLKHGAAASELPPAAKTGMPGWAAFHQARPVLAPLRDALIASGYDGILARSPLRLLRGDLANRPDATERVERALRRARTALADAAGAVEETRAFLDRETLSWGEALAAGAFCRAVQPIAAAEKLAILDDGDISAAMLSVSLDKFAEVEAKAQAAREAAAGWAEDAELPDLKALIEAAQKHEGKFFAFLNGDWRRAKSAVATGYKGAEPGIGKALGLLAEMQRAKLACDQARQAMEKTCGFELTDDIRASLLRIWTAGSSLPDIERDIIRICLDREDAAAAVQKLARQSTALRRAEEELAVILSGHARLTREAIAANLEDLAENTGQIAEFADLLADLDKAGAEISQTIRLVDLPLEQIGIAVLDAAIDRAFRRNRALDRFDSARLEDIVEDLKQRHADLRRLNGQHAVDACHQEFHSDLTRSNESGAGTEPGEKDWRRDFRRGRKTLENEFQKSRAYKSIRELFAGEAGRAMRRLKPVWLMSPLSVADILPLEETLFDVVIFDEASQIPLEDAIPTLYRAKQMIVVGDEMQLPPSSFFSSQGGDPEESDTSELFVYDLNADSFLNRASAVLPRTLLAWHYRSQHEALIEFCNKAFYKSELQTIPSTAELPRREPIRVAAAEDAKTTALAALDQPLSFHRMENSPYDSQRNPGEAAYIAQLVREILNQQKGLSIGVVAFSQAQQQEIESALNALAGTDRAFRTLLDLEEDREHDGQYVGLFVKNLENVQGDERDIIILSVCYGPDAKGRMIMNFGPINQNGGEKRLNVIFSRAKRHMMVVSSIDGAQITNSYNFGANALRKYLTYAQAASTGQPEAMAAALMEYGVRGGEAALQDHGQFVADQIAAELTARGFTASRNHGRSDLKCHIAVKRADAEDYHLAVQIDDRAHYGTADLAARYVVRPSILAAFGWEVMTVLGKDWRDDPAKVVERIAARLAPKPEEVPQEEPPAE
ncbi:MULTISPECIES: AAA domain-containing protein [Rhodomicrobium]|uniref:AAA domain-containing protein n=1 Tax=Rhodomicrobium TaxID=1068 RepID=UPI000B4B0B9F|nr:MULTISPECIES: AAA domain-containing protein [Rhodomicrobium]